MTTGEQSRAGKFLESHKIRKTFLHKKIAVLQHVCRIRVISFSESPEAQRLRERQQREMRETEARLRAEFANEDVSPVIFML